MCSISKLSALHQQIVTEYSPSQQPASLLNFLRPAASSICTGSPACHPASMPSRRNVCTHKHPATAARATRFLLNHFTSKTTAAPAISRRHSFFSPGRIHTTLHRVRREEHFLRGKNPQNAPFRSYRCNWSIENRGLKRTKKSRERAHKQALHIALNSLPIPRRTR